MDLTPHYPQRDGVGVIINPAEQLGSDHHLHQTKKPRPTQKEPSLRLNCPRCTSTDTKFCYYNNYSLSQPRYFCKTCKRYWTEGGTLRNVPVGGGSRRNKRPSSSSSSASSSKRIIIDNHPDHAVPHHLLNHHQWQDLTLNPNPNPNPNPPIISLPPMPIQPVSAGTYTIPTSQDQFLKQGLNFSLNYGYPNGFGSLQLGFQENSINNEGARVFFPSDDQFHQHGTGQGEGTTGGYWTGMLGGGGSW